MLAVLSALLIDVLAARRGLLPPAFRARSTASDQALALVRRVAAAFLLAAVFWVGVFFPLASLGRPTTFDPALIDTPQLFALHVLLLLAAGGWYLLGFGFTGGHRWWRQFGLAAANPLREVGIGLVAGVAAWLSVIVLMIVAGLVLWSLGGEGLVPTEAPPLVPWLAGLPLLLRLGLSLSAGVAEEVFFRGFLQPRTGVVLSSALFVLAHLSYEQPFMLIGVLFLSVVFAALVLWRQNIWAAIIAHATFDAIQLTLMIPWALEHLESAELPLAAAMQVVLW